MFLKRTVSGIVLVAIAIVTIVFGGWILAATLLLLSLIGMREFYHASGVSGRGLNMLELAGYIGAVGYYIVLYFGLDRYILLELAASCALILAVYVFTFPEYHTQEVSAAFFGVFYVAVMLGFIFLTRGRFKGRIEVWLIFFASWGADTCAYLVGVTMGRHKMSPRLSPKKSVEGAIGGILGAAVLGAVYGAIFKQPVLMYMVICAAGAVISIIGDLAASAVKRNANEKDFGKIIPGHGGILDRFDSVIFTAPVIYFLSLLILG
ncbi:MAG: phosphatidate cytidylyltransferase [Lachnospiraceae bacterium]|jgi:phosphatidate cytidylyltransferase|nr:phosphatidate cytidylyltransferase [Lachnospiraceae bacterium]MCI1726512.1 phosphatidate cytidylyltransferase [Lachnospiraceae bacterium]